MTTYHQSTAGNKGLISGGLITRTLTDHEDPVLSMRTASPFRAAEMSISFLCLLRTPLPSYALRHFSSL